MKKLLLFLSVICLVFGNTSFSFSQQLGDTIAVNGSKYKLLSENLISNHGFENGFTGWTDATTSAAQLTSAKFTISTTGGVDNSKYLVGTTNESSTSAGSIGTGWAIESGKTYCFYFHVKYLDASAVSGTADWLKVSLTNDKTNSAEPLKLIDKATINGGGVWTQNAVVFINSNPAYTYVVARFRWLSNLFGFDNFGLFEVAEVIDISGLQNAINTAQSIYNVNAVNAAALQTAINTAQNFLTSQSASAVLQAIADLEDVILSYQKANASFENPLEMTEYIVNPSFETAFTGWENKGMVIQTNNNFPKKTGANYVETWVARGSKVADASIRQQLTGIMNGKYILTTAAGNIQQIASGGTVNNSSTPQTGVTLFAGYQNVAVDTILDRSVDFIVIDNQITIGLKVENATGNWVMCDNFRLYYVGEYTVNDYAGFLNRYMLEMQQILNRKMQNAVRQELETAFSDAQQTISAIPLVQADLTAAKEAIDAVMVKVNKSIEEYAELQTRIDYAHQVLDWYKDEQDKVDVLQPAINTAETDIANYELTSSEIQNAILQLNTAIGKVDKKIIYPSLIYDGAMGGYIYPSQADYQNPNTRFNTSRMRQTKNFIFLWEPGYGDNPETAAAGYKVPLTEILEELEKMYAFYRDDLKFVTKGNSKTDTYKMVAYLFYNKDFGTVYGSGADGAGVVLLYPSRIQNGPYGALAHELGHSFQYMVGADGKVGQTGTAWEMTSQFMLWQYYATWPTFEAYHVTAFMGQSHLAFMHADNQYHSPFVLEYWADNHGQDFVGRLWREAISGDDYVMTYKRLNANMSQSDFNDDMFNGVRRFVTWDLTRGSTIKQHANKHATTMINLNNGWHQVAVSNAPQNYGYNAMRLNVPTAGTTITANFKGLTEATGYNIINKAYAGWRYGFVAYKKDGTTEYSEIYSDTEGQISYSVPANTSYLWFVVMGAPKMHWKHSSSNIAQWPYLVRFGNSNLYGLTNNPVGVTSIVTDNIRVSIENKQLSITGLPSKAAINIYNLAGSLLQKEQTVETTFSTTLSAGVYIVNIQSETGSYNKKIIIH